MEEPKIYEKWEDLLDFLFMFFSKFLKNGGLDNSKDRVLVKDLLGVDICDP